MTASSTPELPGDLWGWMTRLEDGEWGVVGMIAGGFHSPMIFGLERVAKSDNMREVADAHAQSTGQSVKLIHFTAVSVVEAFEPEES